MKHKLSSFIKTNRQSIIGSSVVVLLAVVVSVFVSYKHIDVAETTPTEANNELVSNVDNTQATEEDASTEAVEEIEPELTEEAEETATAKPKEEAETSKEPVTNNKKPSSTKDEVVDEPTTQKPSNVTYDGHKPYEVFTSENGTKVYYDEYGRRCAAEALNAKPITPKYDSDCCHKCGSDACLRTMGGYHCEVCEKDIPASTCHPKSHYNASH